MLSTDKQHLSAQFYDQPVAAMGALPAVPGGWRRNDIVAYFDELWRSAWKRAVKFATASLSSERVGPSARADGMLATMLAQDDVLLADGTADQEQYGTVDAGADAAFRAEYVDADPAHPRWCHASRGGT